ncbi:rhoptry kinase family protein ROP25 [Toxoplasma gondii VEG]|uniref:Rhoptry kinase family protein ROP25 n=2 Tax=Toxoplasma gondii TaxID=5811 RepID=B9QFT6_TOXGV|nr:rhoptry kinase family protein ROP25 [Toxoplasma gondii VEG]KFG45920.1 rhoptry kinase family protein ROP25 [Toxoplasma gondii p89]
MAGYQPSAAWPVASFPSASLPLTSFSSFVARVARQFLLFCLISIFASAWSVLATDATGEEGEAVDDGSADASNDAEVWLRRQDYSSSGLHIPQAIAEHDREGESPLFDSERITRTQSQQRWVSELGRQPSQVSESLPYGGMKAGSFGGYETFRPDKLEAVWDRGTAATELHRSGGARASVNPAAPAAGSAGGSTDVYRDEKSEGKRTERDGRNREESARVSREGEIQFSTGWEAEADPEPAWRVETRRSEQGKNASQWTEEKSQHSSSNGTQKATASSRWGASPHSDASLRPPQESSWPSLLPPAGRPQPPAPSPTHLPSLLPGTPWPSTPFALDPRARLLNYRNEGHALRDVYDEEEGELSDTESLHRAHRLSLEGPRYGFRAGSYAPRRRENDAGDLYGEVSATIELPETNPSAVYPNQHGEGLPDFASAPRTNVHLPPQLGRSGVDPDQVRAAQLRLANLAGHTGHTPGDGSSSYGASRDEVPARRDQVQGRGGPSLLPGALRAGFDPSAGLVSLQYPGVSAFRRPGVLGAASSQGPAKSLLVEGAPQQRQFGASGFAQTPSLLSSSPFLDAFMHNRGGLNLGAQPFATQQVLSGPAGMWGSAGSSEGEADKWWREQDGWVWPELPSLSATDLEAGVKDISGHAQMVRVEAHLVRSQVNAGNALGLYIHQGKRYELLDVEGRLAPMTAIRGKVLGFGAYGVVVELVDVSASGAHRRSSPSSSDATAGEFGGIAVNSGSPSASNSGNKVSTSGNKVSSSGTTAANVEAEAGQLSSAEREGEPAAKVDGDAASEAGGPPRERTERSSRIPGKRASGAVEKSGGSGIEPRGDSGRVSRSVTYAAKIMYWAKAKTSAKPEEVRQTLEGFVHEELEAFKLLRETGISDSDLFQKHGLVVPQSVRRVAKLPTLLRASPALFPDTPLFFHNQLIMFPALKCSLDMLAQDRFTREGLRVLVRSLVRLVAGLHALGFSHNDVKPQNFLVGGDGGLFLGDFAYLAPIDEVQDCNKGFTVDYSSPELMACALKNGRMSMGPERDSWAVGVSAYRLACRNRFPFLLDRKFNAKSDPRLIATHIANLKETDLETSRCGTEDRVVMSIVLRLLHPDLSKRATVDQLVHEPFFQD